MNICVITSGGDSPGMNPCIARIVCGAAEEGHKVFGCRGGYGGILQNDFVPLSPIDVQGWYKLGGTMIKTGRLPELKTTAHLPRLIIESLLKNRIDALIVIGGDGSFRGARMLVRENSGVSIIGIPGTIDNNIFGSQYTLGHDTALNKLVQYIDDISDTAMALPGRVFFVETLGAYESYFPQCAVLMGLADFSVLYEPRSSNSEICDKVGYYRSLKRRDYVLATFTEGAGQALEAAAYVRSKLNLNVKVNLIGFQQRGGVPSALDRLHAAAFAARALDAIKNKVTGQYIVYNEGAYSYLDFEYAANKKVFDNYGFRERELARGELWGGRGLI